MARKRMIDPKFWTDDKVMELKPLCRLLFIGTWNFADDSGVHLNNSKVLKAEIFPSDDITIAEVQAMKAELIELGMIRVSKDEKLFKIVNWEIYQKINRPQPSKYEFSEDSVNVHTPFIGKVIEGKEIKEKVINKVQKVKKPSPPKPYKTKVEDYFKSLDPEFKKLLKDSYPNVDIDIELTKAKTWLLVNTHKAKKQFGRFVNNWMSSAMERAGKYNSASAEQQVLSIREEKIERDRLRQLNYIKENTQNAASDDDRKAALLGNFKGNKNEKTSSDKNKES